MVRLRGHCRRRAAETGSSNLEEEEEERKWNPFHQKTANEARMIGLVR